MYNHQKKFHPKFLLFIPLGIGFLLLLPLVIMWLWNAILPAVIGVKTITYLQAAGIFILSKILFGHFGGGGKYRRGGRHQWKGFSEEDKQRFRQAAQGNPDPEQKD